MKKVVIVLIVAILIIGSIVGFLFWRGSKKKDVTATTDQTVEEEHYYGNRGNISQTEKIKFLSQNDEYLVGMMGLTVSNEVVTFSNDDMIRFALNIAVERYSNILEEKTLNGEEGFVIDIDVVNQITEEFFGIPEVEFDKQTNEYYSKYYKCFFFNENIEKTLYYYPVSMEKNEETGNTEIMVDAIFISDDVEKSVIEEAKYEGKYNEENVDNTIKFIFNGEGKIVSYQYQ